MTSRTLPFFGYTMMFGSGMSALFCGMICGRETSYYICEMWSAARKKVRTVLERRAEIASSTYRLVGNFRLPEDAATCSRLIVRGPVVNQNTDLVAWKLFPQDLIRTLSQLPIYRYVCTVLLCRYSFMLLPSLSLSL
ncbi:hypothetical protein GGR54DRAFT_331998 [Hypoxylon sp. NC1633]|nr:hypothetical protein GGR54DRAFT_331998 [Hypoxylon sp. NC1633]